MLVLSIIHLPLIITAYVKSIIIAEAKINAIIKIIGTLSDKEVCTFIDLLKSEENIHIKLINEKPKLTKIVKYSEQSKLQLFSYEKLSISRIHSTKNKIILKEDNLLLNDLLNKEIKSKIQEELEDKFVYN